VAAQPASSWNSSRAVNTFLGNLKSAYSGTCHAFDFAKYAHRYLAEVQYRFNRRFDLSSILKRLPGAAVRNHRTQRPDLDCGVPPAPSNSPGKVVQTHYTDFMLQRGRFAKDTDQRDNK